MFTTNPWTISRQAFQRQVEWLKAHVDLVSMSDIQSIVREGKNRRIAVHITFDDGYADNCDFAIPMLLSNRIPFTYFVTQENIVQGQPFLHDQNRGQALQTNTLDQIRSLVRAKVTMGAHTRTHPDLSRIESPQILFDEVVTSRDELQDLLQCTIPYFAIPFGQHRHLTKEVFRLARAQRTLGVCSAYGGYNLPGGDDFHIQRIHGDPEFIRFVNHVSDDPMQRCVSRFEYRYQPVPPRSNANDSNHAPGNFSNTSGSR